MPKSTPTSYHTAAFIVLLCAAAVALIAAFVLSIEKIHLLTNPSATLLCSFNLVLNCSTVMQSWQSSVFFGIPNMFIGLMAFPVLVTVSVAALLGKVRFSRQFITAMVIGVFAGTVFAYWLFFNSVYVIQVLCPWCLLVTLACTLMFAAVTHIALTENSFGLPKNAQRSITLFIEKGYHKLVVAIWIVLMAVIVFLQFGFDLFS